MTRIKAKDWTIAEEIAKRRVRVTKKYPLFFHKVCSCCGDAVVRESIWKVDTNVGYKFVCTTCADTWEKAHDMGRDPNNKGVCYSNSY